MLSKAVLALLALSIGAQSIDMECVWCMNVVMNAQQFFGEGVAAVTDVEFVEYFHRECRLDRRKSAMYSVVCYDMLENHPLALINDLRNNASVIQTCNDCDFCLFTTTVAS